MSNKAHAKFSPSSVERWTVCPASIQRSQGQESRESVAAAEGTRAHACLELLLKNGREKSKRTFEFIEKSFDRDMIDHALNAAAWLWWRAGDLRVESEKRVTLEHIDKDLWGTLDATIVEDFGTLEIIDYKYGKYLPVEATANKQLLTYAIGEARKHHNNFDRVRLTIIQPRAEHAEGPIRSWTTGVDRLIHFGEELKDAVARARAKKPAAHAGEHCLFCPAKPVCKDYTPEATASLRAGFVAASQARESPEQTKRRLSKIFENSSSDTAPLDEDSSW